MSQAVQTWKEAGCNTLSIGVRPLGRNSPGRRGAADRYLGFFTISVGVDLACDPPSRYYSCINSRTVQTARLEQQTIFWSVYAWEDGDGSDL